MTTGAAILMLLMCFVMCGMTVVYERLLTQARNERDEAIADIDLTLDLYHAARDRHPSAQYGQGHIRLVK